MPRTKKPQIEPLNGRLDIFLEQGKEAVKWVFMEDIDPAAKNNPLEGMHVLKKGDVLLVFNDAARMTVFWEGVIDLERKSGFQKNEDHEKWKRMFDQVKPAELVPYTPPRKSKK